MTYFETCSGFTDQIILRSKTTIQFLSLKTCCDLETF